MDRLQEVDDPDYDFVHGFIVREGNIVQVFKRASATLKSQTRLMTNRVAPSIHPKGTS